MKPRYENPPKPDTRELDALLAEWQAADPKRRGELETRQIPMAMLVAGVREHAGFVLKNVVHARVRPGREAEADVWLREHADRQRDVGQVVRKRLHEGAPMPPSELFQIETRPVARASSG